MQAFNRFTMHVRNYYLSRIASHSINFVIKISQIAYPCLFGVGVVPFSDVLSHCSLQLAGCPVPLLIAASVA